MLEASMLAGTSTWIARNIRWYRSRKKMWNPDFSSPIPPLGNFLPRIRQFPPQWVKGFQSRITDHSRLQRKI